MHRGEFEDPSTILGGVTDRRLSALRLTLAVAALIIIYAIPSEPDRYVHLTYYSLIAHAIYSFAVYAIARRRINFSQTTLRSVVAIDLAWYTLLTAISSGTNGLFFFYLFAVIVASSRGGPLFGFLVTVISAALSIGVGFFAAPQGAFDQTRFVMRPLAIVGLGYILAF